MAVCATARHLDQFPGQVFDFSGLCAWGAEALDDLSMAVRGDRAVAGKGCQYPLVPEVLDPPAVTSWFSSRRPPYLKQRAVSF
jgi:hypothetical protein